MRTFLRAEAPGRARLLDRLVFGAVFLAPELELTRAALNDDIHQLRHGESLWDRGSREGTA